MTDWTVIRAEYEGSRRPVTAIAADQGCSSSLIYRRAKTEGWSNPRKSGGKGGLDTFDLTEGLTARQRLFVAEYLIDRNATQAAVRAGYSPASASVLGVRLLRHPKLCAAIEAGLRALCARADITAERVLQEYARIGFGDLRQVMEWGPDGITLKPSSELTDADAAVVAEVTQTTAGAVKVKLRDKKGALDALARHLNLFAARAKPQDAAVEPVTLTAEEYRKLGREVDDEV